MCEIYMYTKVKMVMFLSFFFFFLIQSSETQWLLHSHTSNYAWRLGFIKCSALGFTCVLRCVLVLRGWNIWLPRFQMFFQYSAFFQTESFCGEEWNISLLSKLTLYMSKKIRWGVKSQGMVVPCIWDFMEVLSPKYVFWRETELYAPGLYWSTVYVKR